MRYYIRRSIEKEIEYDEGYWKKEDPDGKMRNREEEKELAIDDLKDEISYINNLQAGKILDVGCGFGFLLSAIYGNWEKHGVDLSEYALEHARKYAHVQRADICDDMKIVRGFFDVITATHVFEHLENPEMALGIIKMILRPQGKLIIVTPNFDSACARRFKEKYRMLHDPTHINLFTEYSLRRMLTDKGFHVDKIEYPFFNTRHFTQENLMRLFDTTKVSPPFYGNIMSFYCTKL